MPNSIVNCSNLQLYAATDAAILVGRPGLTSLSQHDREKAWIPLSLVDSRDIHEVGDIGYIEIPQWIAERNDIEYD